MFNFMNKKVSQFNKKLFFNCDYQKQLTQKATVTHKIAPSKPGRVYYRATYWFAICEQEIIIEKDTLVYVKEIKGIILSVEPFTCKINYIQLPKVVNPLTKEEKALQLENALTGAALTGMLF